MLVTGIKSKPVYAPLRADTRGRYHLMLGLGTGSVALLRVLDEMQSSAAPQALARPASCSYRPSSARGCGSGAPPVTAAAQPRDRCLGLEVRVFADVPTLLGSLRALLEARLDGHAPLRRGSRRASSDSP